MKWWNCIIENGSKTMDAQNICSIYAIDYVPRIAYITSAETSTAILGISIFIVFGTRVDLWSEWKLYFIKKFGESPSSSNREMTL